MNLRKIPFTYIRGIYYNYGFIDGAYTGVFAGFCFGMVAGAGVVFLLLKMYPS